MADYTPYGADVFGNFINGLKMGMSLKKEKADAQRQAAQDLLAQDKVMREKVTQNLEIPARTGGFWKSAEDMTRGIGNLTANAPRPYEELAPSVSMQDTLSPQPSMIPFMQARNAPVTQESLPFDPAQIGAQPSLIRNQRVSGMTYPEAPKQGYAAFSENSTAQADQFLKDTAAMEALAFPKVSITTDPNTGATIREYLNPKGTLQSQAIAKPQQSTSGGAVVPDLTSAGIDFAAKTYIQTGVMPNVGMGNAGNRTKIINRAAELSKDPTGQVDISSMITNNILNKANASSYAQLQKQADNISAFEKTAQKNLAVTLAQANKLDRSGQPVYNAWVNAGRRAVTGNPDITGFDLALRTFINEYARITTSVTGGGVTSDTARKEVEDLLKANFTPEQFTNAAKVAQQDMQNRLDSYAEQFKEIRTRSEDRTRNPSKLKDPKVRLNELVQSGKSEKEAYRTMAQEGYK